LKDGLLKNDLLKDGLRNAASRARGLELSRFDGAFSPLAMRARP
jgi:hypothetical protein